MANLSDEAVIDCATAHEWEAWLGSHCNQSGGVWWRIAKKKAEKSSVTISEALDVALCYGWIDSQRKGFDQSYYLQRYSPRRSKSPWSKLNVERAMALITSGRMQPTGFLEIEKAKQDSRWQGAYEPQRNVTVPSDLEAALAYHPHAPQAFDRLDKSSQYTLMLPILKATTAKGRAARLQKVMKTLAE